MKKIFTKNYLILIPILILYSISIFTMQRFPDYHQKHLLWITLSIGIFFLTTKINLQKILNNHLIFYFICIFLLVFVLFTGKEVNGARAWIDFHFFSLQPSELAKLALIVTLSVLSLKKVNIFYLIILTIIPSILTYLEPDTGAIITYLIIFLVCLTNYNFPKRFIIISTIIILLLIGTILYIYFFSQDLFIDIFGTSIFYRLDRLKSFTTLDNIQIENALTAISTHEYLYFPEAHTDFIFALAISTLPNIFTIIIIINYIIILISLNYKSLSNKKLSSTIYKIILYLFLFQIFQNILMNIGLAPIIGIPLPFLSYGGSYTLTTAILLGIAFNIEKNRYKIKKLNKV